MPELAGQPVTHLVIAGGSLGSMAGLILGTWASGLDCQVHGYTVLWSQAEAITRLQDLLQAARRQYFPAVTTRPYASDPCPQRGDGATVLRRHPTGASNPRRQKAMLKPCRSCRVP